MRSMVITGIKNNNKRKIGYFKRKTGAPFQFVQFMRLINRLIILPGMLHTHPCLDVQTFQVICQFLEFAAGAAHSNGFVTTSPKRLRTDTILSSLGNINACRIVHRKRSSLQICHLAASPFIIADSIYLMTRAHRCGGAACINRTLRRRGWLTDFHADVTVLGTIHQAMTLSS